MKNPCNGCTKRYSECHPSCKEYKEFRDECDASMKERERVNLSTPDPTRIIKRAFKVRNKKWQKK